FNSATASPPWVTSYVRHSPVAPSILQFGHGVTAVGHRRVGNRVALDLRDFNSATASPPWVTTTPSTGSFSKLLLQFGHGVTAVVHSGLARRPGPSRPATSIRPRRHRRGSLPGLCHGPGPLIPTSIRPRRHRRGSPAKALSLLDDPPKTSIRPRRHRRGS